MIIQTGDTYGNLFRVYWDGNDNFRFHQYDGSSYVMSYITTAKYRDTAWYHYVISIDTTLAAAADRARLYVNGVEVTDWSQESNPAQSLQTGWNAAIRQRIGREYTTTYGNYYNYGGYLADFYNIDGQQLDCTSFGKFDDNGVWQAKDASGLTFGTNGFHLFDFASESGIGNDSSGNDNDFSVSNLTAPGNFGITKAAQIVGTSKTFSFPITYTTTLTYEFFVRITTDGTYNYMAKMSGDQWNLGTSGSSLLFGNYNGGWTTFSSTGLNDSNWHFVRLTTTGSSTSLYVDGSLIATNSSGGSVSTGSQITNEIRGTGSGAFEIAHLRITTGGTPPTTGVPDISSMNAAAGSGGTLAFYDALDDIASSGTKTSDGGSVTITMSAATVGVTDANTDVLRDVPTNGDSSNDTGAGGEVSGNYCVMNPLHHLHAATLVNGNLQTTSNEKAFSTFLLKTGKWYVEHKVDYAAYNLCFSQIDHPSGATPSSSNSKSIGWYLPNGYVYWGAGYSASLGGTTMTGLDSSGYMQQASAGDIVAAAIDMDNSIIKFYKNGTEVGSIDFSTGNAHRFTEGMYVSQFNGYGHWNFGQNTYAHAAPSNYKALCTTNLPTPTIANGRDHFDTKLYTGNGGSSTITVSGLNFAPNLVWLKGRSDPDKHGLYDTVRGATKLLIPSSNAGESTQNGVTAFNSDGFDIGNYAETNGSSRTYVAWAWNIPGSASSNSDGTITSSVTKNADAGISLVTWTGNDSAGTIGHGLGSKPDLIVVKVYGDSSYADNWPVYSSVFDGTHYAYLNDTRKFTDFAGFWNDGTATSTVFPIGDYNSDNTKSLLALCFTSVDGFSKIGSYEGNGSSNGPFVFTGMRPALVLARNADTSGEDWWIVDTARETFNPQDQILLPNSDNAEITTSNPIIDILSNGFKLRNANARFNASGTTYVYASFASNPFQANGGLAR